MAAHVHVPRKRRKVEPEIITLDAEDDCLDMVVWQPPVPPPAVNAEPDDDADCCIIPEWLFQMASTRAEASKSRAGRSAVIERALVPVPVSDSDPDEGKESDDYCDRQRLHDFQKHVWGELHRSCTEEETCRASLKERAHKRPDIKAWEKVKQEGLYFFRDLQVGEPRGLYVGFTCYSRGEMAATGLHRKIVHGIDFIPANTTLIPNQQAKEIRLPVAVSIVMSGGYEDNRDYGDTIYYTGQGGRINIKGTPKQFKPQLLNEANRAMKNSMLQQVPIRVMRALKPKTYVYSGLYEIEATSCAPGLSGHMVYTFKLQRLPGQDPLPEEKVISGPAQGYALPSRENSKLYRYL